MPLRLATGPFLESLPLVDSLKALPPTEVVLSFGLPSQLAELLHADEVDVALLPVVEMFRGFGRGFIPGIAIAARGPADSVKLCTRKAPAALEHVVVDHAAVTSVALLRVLLAELYDVRPDFHAVRPSTGDLLQTGDAALVVGDHCFEIEKKWLSEGADDVQRIDLVDLWVKMTGLPFVFSVWTLGRDYTQRATAQEQKELFRFLSRARDHGLARREVIAEREAARGRLGPGGHATVESIHRYLTRSLQYELGEQEMTGLRRFYELCLKHTICPAGHPPELAAAGRGD
jgi:predicted solute-binding protein